MDRRTFLTVVTGTIVAGAGCLGGSNRALPDTPTGQWAQYAHDSRKTGASDAAVPERGNKAWDAGEAQSAEPLIADGVVFSVADSVTALDGKTGEQQLEYDLEGTTDTTPAVVDDRLLVATDEQLIALACDDGSELWAESLPLGAAGAVTAAGSLAIVPLEARRDYDGLIAYDVEWGEQHWTHPTFAARSPVVEEEIVYTTGYRQDGDTGILRALTTSDGSLEWEVELDHPDTSPVVADGELFVCDSGELAVHDLTDGERSRTLRTFADHIYEPPAVANGVAYLGSNDPAINAVSTDDGSIEWSTDGAVGARISVGNDAVIVSAEGLPETSGAGVTALEQSTGTIRWEYHIEGFDAYPSTAPALADNAVFFVSNAISGVTALGDLPPEEE
ncbi:PQQ-binding-like beta-propeller repeat protein [Halorubrum sp. AD140]|uniref:outer membrane protein assembly factor BamB family protein n=1 Tax=Halorubrum sp. AD140 TaxID=3050073 RepID=UPI002ACCB162|nr:PQQ-binding-like beta-propeller repeat protein [Halorubrum sp. AD140]MDZ5811644.1 PQQ-binding-like beta-propeller repeat protein [Halorubrum sp. AD140]